MHQQNAARVDLSVRSSCEIHRAPCLLEGYTRHRLQIDHRGSHIAVAEQLLDRLDVVVGQQEMACKCVPECMR